jgi:hypothetical protein
VDVSREGKDTMAKPAKGAKRGGPSRRPVRH